MTRDQPRTLKYGLDAWVDRVNRPVGHPGTETELVFYLIFVQAQNLCSSKIIFVQAKKKKNSSNFRLLSYFVMIFC